MEAVLARRLGNEGAAAAIASKIRPQIERLAEEEPSDRAFVLEQARACLLEAQLQAPGSPSAADFAERAVNVMGRLVGEGRANNADIGELARACVVAGTLVAQTGDAAAAQHFWQRAEDLLHTRVPGSRDWRLLDPAARTAAALGRIDEARLIIEKLQKNGYVPVDPWPAAFLPAVPIPANTVP